MSGHSKWASIKHRKADKDAKRGKIFTKLIKEITVAARLGGGDPEANARLRTVLLASKAANMPADNIKRAIKKGTGELPGVQYEEVVYEGYGPAGVAVYVEGMTDNKNRTLPELRHLFSKFGGHLGEANCVAWMFDKKGYLVVERKGIPDEEIFEQAIEAGADDIREDGENLEVLTPTDRLEAVHEALSKGGVQIAAAQIAMVPKTTVKLEGSSVKKILGMMEALEDHDDVQHVWSNFDIDPAEIRD